MCTDDTFDTYESPDDSSQGTYEAPDDGAAGGRPAWSRRTFLKAAALGTAAAALLHKGGDGGLGNLSFGPLSALADDLSKSQCTANDVRINGPGVILNEPCDCSGTFTAQVLFNVTNNAANSNWCVTLHLAPTTVNGQPFNPGDIVVAEEIKGKSTGDYIATIANYPCGSGLTCFGDPVPDTYSKGPCPSARCSTVSYYVNQPSSCPAPAGTKVTSKCRHQQICIQGRGNATLDCNTSESGVQTNCPVDCGGNTTVRLCTTGGPAPYTFTLKVPGQPDQVRTSSNLCEDFSVTLGAGQDPVTITGTVKDSGSPSCTDTVTTTLVPQTPEAPTLEITAGPDCNGEVTVSVVDPVAGTTYEFFEGSESLGSGDGTSITKTYALPETGSDEHCISATATKGGCTSEPSDDVCFDIYSAVTAALGAPQSDCSGVVTLLATAGGGQGGYSFQFNGASGTVSGSGNTRTLTLDPQLDNACRTVTVTVTDSATCSATSAPRSFKQCVTTTACP